MFLRSVSHSSIPVVVVVGILKGVMDRARVPHLCCPLPFKVDVSPPHHLGSQQKASLLCKVHVCHDALVRVLQVALVGVEHHWRVPVELLLKVDDNCIDGCLHVGVLCIYEQPHIALQNKQASLREYKLELPLLQLMMWRQSHLMSAMKLMMQLGQSRHAVSARNTTASKGCLCWYVTTLICLT